MAKRKMVGACALCGSKIESSEMAKHLGACRSKAEKPGGGKREKLYHIAVEGAGIPEYWMHVEIPCRATLADLDGFLRDTWLECCGHLSAFEIGKTRYVSGEDAGIDEDEGMDVALAEVLKPGMKFGHEYDFGSTTELALRVISEHDGERPKDGVRVLARNDPPEIPCGECGKPAVLICPECACDGKGWLCKACAKKHECGDETMLPVVNSPRVGVCGYCGPEDADAGDDEPDEDEDEEEEE
jgi:hypothetical protein